MHSQHLFSKERDKRIKDKLQNYVSLTAFLTFLRVICRPEQQQHTRCPQMTNRTRELKQAALAGADDLACRPAMEARSRGRAVRTGFRQRQPRLF